MSADASRLAPRLILILVALILTAILSVSVRADGVTFLASYEPSETDLTVTRVPGGADGAPAATDGDYVLKLQFAGEDGKIEFTHAWASQTYDLAGEDALLADVYVATSSALPGIVGVWDSNWNPPDAWQSAAGVPTAVGVWTTLSFDVSSRSQIGLDRIWAFVLEDMPGASGTVYVDNLRLTHVNPPVRPDGLAALSYETYTILRWDPVVDPAPRGYNVYRSDTPTGPYLRRNADLLTTNRFTDAEGPGAAGALYRITSVIGDEESEPSEPIATWWNGLSDAELLDLTQEAAFRYFWDYAHPVCGLARESYTHWSEIVAVGGSGMGLMAIPVGVERGFVTRQDAADRVLLMLTFLEESATRYHGAWSHWINGSTGETIPFSDYDDGADLVETSYLVQGMLTVRRYFDGEDEVETEIRERATRLWEDVEWDWFRRYPGGQALYWHWSPNYGWQMNLPIHGYDEAMITYLLAIASPTHPMPATCYYYGWASQAGYANGNTYYGVLEWVGPAYGGPLFFTHYSNLGFDPRYKSDAYCNYHENARNISLIHQAYAVDNPLGFAGYNEWLWGLTASSAPPPVYYDAFSPTNDNGTVAPTAALSAMPYVPAESMATVRYLYDTYGAGLWGPYGFRDALNPQAGWYSDTYIAIDQGPIVVMIENYRSGLCWRLFMSNPEIKPMLQSIGWTFDADLDADGDVTASDLAAFAGCMTGPDAACPTGCDSADFDDDGDADLADFTTFQQAYGAQ